MQHLYVAASFQILSKICWDICKSRGPTGINDTGGKFAISTAGVNDTSGKWWEQNRKTYSLKKKKMLTLLPKAVQTKYFRKFKTA